MLVSIELKVINCFIIWHILYVIFIFKMSFYRNVFFGLAWYVTSRQVNKFYIYLVRDEYNVLSKNVTRDVSQSEKTLSEVIW